MILCPGRKERWYALFSMIRKPNCSRSWGSIPLTGPKVPTGMNAGVSTTPRAVVSVPSLALVSRSVWSTVKFMVVRSMALHLIGGGNTEYSQTVLDDLLYAPHQRQPRGSPFRTQRFALGAFVGRNPWSRLCKDFRIRGRGQNPVLVVKGMEQRGELLQIVSHPMRLIANRRGLQHRRIGGQLPDQPQFVRIGQQREVRTAWGRTGDPTRSSHPPETRNTGMRILDVVHGIVSRSLLGEFEIEFEVRFGIPHEEIEFGGIGTHFVDDFPHRNELARPLRHLYFFTGSQQLHELHEHNLQALFGMAIGLHDRLHTRDVDMVIGAPNVDEQIIATPQFVPMIRDVGSQVGVLPALLLDDAVFLVPKVRRAEPPGPVLLKDEPTGLQLIQHALDGL